MNIKRNVLAIVMVLTLALSVMSFAVLSEVTSTAPVVDDSGETAALDHFEITFDYSDECPTPGGTGCG